MPGVILPCNASDYAFGLGQEGRLCEIKIRNVDVVRDVLIDKSYLINHLPFQVSPIQYPFTGAELAMWMLSSHQDYSNTHLSHPLHAPLNNFNIPYPNTLLNGTSLQIYNAYNLNHRFRKSFVLRPYDNSGDEMRFIVFFFPFIKREYSATLVIKHGFINYDSNTNTYSSPLDMRFILKFRGSLFGNVDEIDHTDYPQLVFEVDFNNVNNILEIH
tara:strand:+ start:1099 stop:1743 length:645 start_codon:yes stop_codon:yes gene_type:complete